MISGKDLISKPVYLLFPKMSGVRQELGNNETMAKGKVSTTMDMFRTQKEMPLLSFSRMMLL
jgi:hypothetical protein